MPEPKTLLFCTSFALCRDVWRSRYQRWLEGIRWTALEYDQILLVDDCSPPPPPDWSDLVIVPADGATVPDKPLVMARFDTHLGRRSGPGHSTSPGWYRSFGYAAQYAQVGNFGRIVHIESDAYVLSRRLEKFLNQCLVGWTTLWCPRHCFAEDNIQVITGPAIAQCRAFFSEPYVSRAGAAIERQYPFSAIDQSFVGDRYGEYRSDVPKHADYVVQALEYPKEPDSYFWWLAGERTRWCPSLLDSPPRPMMMSNAATICSCFATPKTRR